MPCRPEHARALRPNASAVRRRGGRCRGAERAGRRPTAGLAAQAGRGCASPKLLLAGASASTAGAAGAHGTWVRLRASPSRGSGASAQREAPMRASPRFGGHQVWGPEFAAPGLGSAQVRADPAAVRGARCVLDKLRRALERPLARLRRSRSPDLPAAAAVYQHALLAFARRLLQARARPMLGGQRPGPMLAEPHQTREPHDAL